MYKGETTKGIDFYNLLYSSDEFCLELGKVALAAGRLEAGLIKGLRNKGVTKGLEKAPLGKLIKIANDGNHIDINMYRALDITCKQRNYLTHNIYALFIELIEETILERDNLLDSDVLLFIERARQLQENINGLAETIENEF